MANNDIIEEVPVLPNEIYQPGTLKQLCLKKVDEYFHLFQLSRKELPMTLIDELYVVSQEEKHKRYIYALINEFQSHAWNSMPYRFSPNLFDAVLYPDETTVGFNVDELIMASWEEYYRISLYYGLKRCTFYNMRYCRTCLFNTDHFRNMRVTIIECSHEGDRNNIINVITTRMNYCGICGVRLYCLKISNDPSADAVFESEIIDIDDML